MLTMPPDRSPPSRLTPFVRAVISRVTMLAVAIALLFGSFKTFSVVARMRAELAQGQAQRAGQSGSAPGGKRSDVHPQMLPLFVAVGMGLFGLVVLVAAVVPSTWFERFVRAPSSDRPIVPAKARDYFR